YDFKKRREEKEAKEADCVKKTRKLDCYFRSQDASTFEKIPSATDSNASDTKDLSEEMESGLSEENEATEKMEVEEISPSLGASVLIADLEIDISDVANFPSTLSENLRTRIIQTGPNQIDMKFPITNGRTFSSNYYSKTLTNNERVKREWLIYSRQLDSVHCFCCLLFNSNAQLNPFNASQGFSDWRHLSQAIQRHETSASHLDNFCIWKEQFNRLSNNTTIECQLEKSLLDRKKQLKQVFERFVAMTMFLARQNIAFAGTDNTSGNFYELAQTIGEFDLVMKNHLESSSRNKYLGPATQNELITIVGNKVRQHIIDQIIESKYYSLILDCTSDVSRQEQMTFVIRYVHFDVDKRFFQIKESFIEFVDVSETTGKAMADIAVNNLNKHKIEIKNMRGQGYDNGSNMKGKHIGVQAQIQSINPLAVFIPCSNHTLNLSLNDAASASIEVCAFFATVQKIYTFLSASTTRWDILKKHCTSIHDLVPKALSTTRWSARLNAIKPLRRNLNKILATLDEISNSESFEPSVRYEAECIINFIDFKFICSVCIWHAILENFDRVSKLMQRIDMNLSGVETLLSDISQFLAEYKENGYERAITEATEIADELEIPANFEQTRRGRPRRNETDPEKLFKENFFDFVVDVASESIEDRFKVINSHSKLYAFLYEYKEFNALYSSGELITHCKLLKETLTHNNESDIDAEELCNELRIVGKIMESHQIEHTIDILNEIAKKRLENSLPNAVIAYKILLTLPVSVATGERTFSKLKLTKTYLRSTMLQERLSNLAIISIEQDVAKTLNYDQIIDEFAHLKARKCNFD
ncbi:zinc finger MYM-type protein 1-like, partial [Sitodiplosis mosellana]|uniref:zinc finger MYM-type protein 1-like n=2 Tax=Sitodiplosis mosellana TaxID=263140 RepID=UPI0024442154